MASSASQVSDSSDTEVAAELEGAADESLAKDRKKKQKWSDEEVEGEQTRQVAALAEPAEEDAVTAAVAEVEGAPEERPAKNKKKNKRKEEKVEDDHVQNFEAFAEHCEKRYPPQDGPASPSRREKKRKTLVLEASGASKLKKPKRPHEKKKEASTDIDANVAGRAAAFEDAQVKTTSSTEKTAVKSAPSQHRRAILKKAAKRNSVWLGKKVAIEIKHYRESTELLMTKTSFQRLVREIVQVIQGEKPQGTETESLRFHPQALLALHEASEAYLVGLLEDAYLCTVHRKRVTLMDYDLHLASRLNPRRYYGAEKKSWISIAKGARCLT